MNECEGQGVDESDHEGVLKEQANLACDLSGDLGLLSLDSCLLLCLSGREDPLLPFLRFVHIQPESQ